MGIINGFKGSDASAAKPLSVKEHSIKGLDALIEAHQKVLDNDAASRVVSDDYRKKIAQQLDPMPPDIITEFLLQLHLREKDFITGKFLSDIVNTSYADGFNEFVIPTGHFASLWPHGFSYGFCDLTGTQENPLKITIDGPTGRQWLHGCQYIDLHVKGDVGFANFNHTKDSKVVIDGAMYGGGYHCKESHFTIGSIINDHPTFAEHNDGRTVQPFLGMRRCYLKVRGDAADSTARTSFGSTLIFEGSVGSDCADQVTACYVYFGGEQRGPVAQAATESRLHFKQRCHEHTARYSYGCKIYSPHKDDLQAIKASVMWKHKSKKSNQFYITTKDEIKPLDLRTRWLAWKQRRAKKKSRGRK